MPYNQSLVNNYFYNKCFYPSLISDKSLNFINIVQLTNLKSIYLDIGLKKCFSYFKMGVFMYLKIEITDENVEKITELRKNGVNITEYLNNLLSCNDILQNFEIFHAQ